MVWEASVRMMGLTVRGYDRLLDGRGEMLWKLLGLVPVMRRSGADVTRSAAGRMAAESVWLPQMLLDAGVDCRDVDGGFAASLDVCGHRQEVRFRLDSDGRLLALRMKRWGDPDGRGHRLVDFGGIALEESTFDGVKIPSRMRIGWFWDGSGFRGDGEFFRVAIDAAEFG